MSIKQIIKDWLDIQPANPETIFINRLHDRRGDINRAEMWYNGEPFELEQYYKQSNEAGSATFWAAVPEFPIRKIHSGIPALMVNILSAIVVRDLNGVKLADGQDTYDAIANDNDINGVIEDAIKKALIDGDAFFKLSYDADISAYPIIEAVGGKDVEIITKRGRPYQYIFMTQYNFKNQNYILKETYGKGYITYELTDRTGTRTYSTDLIPETAGLTNITYDGDFFLCCPLIIKASERYAGRGESIYHGKTAAFDALDEILSQWGDAFRAGRVKTYIPASMIPKNPETGAILKPNAFDDRYIAISSTGAENDKNVIVSEQAEIRSEQYVQGYITYLDLVLQGVISPSTLGIDTKKLDNADAQREKEKVTLYTRNKIIEALTRALKYTVNAALKCYDLAHGQPARADTDVTCDFGEYANPSFEAAVETVAKAKAAGIMSVEMCVDTLYGDSLSDDDKKAECERIRNDQATDIGDPYTTTYDY